MIDSNGMTRAIAKYTVNIKQIIIIIKQDMKHITTLAQKKKPKKQ